jgi:hypothetical protein
MKIEADQEGVLRIIVSRTAEIAVVLTLFIAVLMSVPLAMLQSFRCSSRRLEDG